MSIELLSLLLFGGFVVGLILGVPIAFIMGGIAIAASWMLWGPESLLVVVTETFGWLSSFIMIAVPLFVLMGILLERSGIAEDLFEMMHRWGGSLKGGLAIGTIVICVLFAAMTGVTAAATVTMGLIALPAMLRRDYDKSIALGCILGGGTLGILIPPSVMMVLLGMIMQVSVGKLFAAGIFSGLAIGALFIIYIVIRSYLQPQLCPAAPVKYTMMQKVSSLRSVILPMLLIVAVLGSIFSGAATPTEAAAVGAVGALLCVFIYRRFSWKLLKDACSGTLRISSMIIWIVIGASVFVRVYTALGAIGLIQEMILGLELNRWLILIGMMVILFIMGMFLDPGGIIMLAAPLFSPLVSFLGFDLVWFGILFIINLQIGYLTPPFGYNLFYLKAIAPPSVSMADIYRAVGPFVLIMILATAIIIIFPQIALWLPSMIK
jgi:tripartite ATP-independent transporter DctM subunit